MTEPNKPSTREIVTAVIAGAIVLAAVVYWIIQIQGVLEVFKKIGG